MNPQLLPAQLRDDAPAWAQTVAASSPKGCAARAGAALSRATRRMLWPFFERLGSPRHVTRTLP